MQHAPVLGLGHHPTASRHHEGVTLPDGLQHLSFEGPEACFTVLGKNLGDRPACNLFNHGIGIHEAVAQSFGERAAAAALATAHHPH